MPHDGTVPVSSSFSKIVEKSEVKYLHNSPEGCVAYAFLLSNELYLLWPYCVLVLSVFGLINMDGMPPQDALNIEH